MTQRLNEKQIAELLDRLADRVAEALAAEAPPESPTPLALVGIRSRGEIFAHRLQSRLEQRWGGQVDCGTLDITLYRDDLNQMGYQQPRVRSTEIPFSIDDRVILLVDDVLNTGRSVRAALDALVDFGRPKAIRLAVLIDRGHRELPISADYVGIVLEAPIDKRVNVYVREVDDREEVVVE